MFDERKTLSSLTLLRVFESLGSCLHARTLARAKVAAPAFIKLGGRKVAYSRQGDLNEWLAESRTIQPKAA